MNKNPKSYTPEFNQQIAELYNAGGTSYPQLEREYGVNRSTYYKALVRVPSNSQRHMAEQGLRSVSVKNITVMPIAAVFQMIKRTF